MSLNPLETAIDLTTAHGIKQYDKATKGTVTKIDLTNDPEAAEAFMTKLKVDSRKFCFGPVTTHAEIEIAGVEEGTDLTNPLTDYSKITRDRVIETGGVLFGCAFDINGTHDRTCVAKPSVSYLPLMKICIYVVLVCSNQQKNENDLKKPKLHVYLCAYSRSRWWYTRTIKIE